jgi:hypothetical protein
LDLILHQVMRVDEITLREEYGTIAMDFDNGFGEMPDIAQVCEEEWCNSLIYYMHNFRL